MHGKMFRSIPGCYSLNAGNIPLPSCGHQKCLQSLRRVSWWTDPPPVEGQPPKSKNLELSSSLAVRERSGFGW